MEDFADGPRIPKRLIADDGSGISCCNLLPLSSLRGKGGGGAEGFGIGGADGFSIVNPSELTDGDTTTERDLGVDGTLLDAGVFKSTRGDTEGALLDGRDAEGALLDAGVFKSTRGDTERALPSGRDAVGAPPSSGDLLDAGVAGLTYDAGVAGPTYDACVAGPTYDAGVPGRRIDAGVGG